MDNCNGRTSISGTLGLDPKGKVTESYGLWNEERGAGTRAVMVVDKSGVIRFLEKYVPGTLPDPNEILQFVKSL